MSPRRLTGVGSTDSNLPMAESVSDSAFLNTDWDEKVLSWVTVRQKRASSGYPNHWFNNPEV